MVADELTWALCSTFEAGLEGGLQPAIAVDTNKTPVKHLFMITGDIIAFLSKKYCYIGNTTCCWFFRQLLSVLIIASVD
jgi:hypothetical protein